MRCAKCGRLPKPEAPKWALPCQCGAGPQVPEHPCGSCPEDRRMDCLFASGMPKCDSLAAWLPTVPMDGMVAAIRADKLVGRGTCSSIDECLDDADLRRELATEGCSTEAEALKWARRHEGLFLEQGLNQRWGEDDDPQLAAHREFEAADKADPV